MKLTVNGKPHTHAGDGSLDALMAELDAAGKRVAIMVNGQVIVAAKRETVQLQEGDDVELLVFAGGG